MSSKRITWRSLPWKVSRTKHVERYRYEWRSKSRRTRRKQSRRRSFKKSLRFRKDVQKRRRVKLPKPIYWTEYYADAEVGGFRFSIARYHQGDPYTATAHRGNLKVGHGYGDSPVRAFNALLDDVVVNLRELQRAATKALKVIGADDE